MSGLILVTPHNDFEQTRRLRWLYIKRLFGFTKNLEQPIRVFLRKSQSKWDLLKNKKNWVCDPSLFSATTEQLVNRRYETVSPRYYSRIDDYIVVIPTPVGNVVLIIELFNPNLTYKHRDHNVAVAVPEHLLPYLGHEFEDIDEVLGVIHYRPSDNDDDSLYRQVEEIIYREAVNNITWVVAIATLVTTVSYLLGNNT